MSDEHFSLQWDNFHKNMSAGIQSLLESEDLVDVTLAVEGRQLKAHKMVLSLCSPYFRQLFQSSPCKHPIVFMRDVTYTALIDLLQFMYHGEVQVAEENLSIFLKTAEALQIKGLAEDSRNHFEDLIGTTKSTNEATKRSTAEVSPPFLALGKRLRSKRVRVSSPSPSSSAAPAVVPAENLIFLKTEPSDNTETSTDKEVADETQDSYVDETSFEKDNISMETNEDEPKPGTSSDGTGESQHVFEDANFNMESYDNCSQKRKVTKANVTEESDNDDERPIKRQKKVNELPYPPLPPPIAAATAQMRTEQMLANIENLQEQQVKMFDVMAHVYDMLRENRTNGNLTQHTCVCSPAEESQEVDVSNNDEDFVLMSSLPMSSVENFQMFDKNIKERPALREKVVKKLKCLWSKNLKNLVSNVMQKLMQDEVGELYSLTGRTVKNEERKMSFLDTECYTLLFEICRRLYPDEGKNEATIKNSISHWLQQAKFRKTRKEARIKKNSKESDIEQETD